LKRSRKRQGPFPPRTIPRGTRHSRFVPCSTCVS